MMQDIFQQMLQFVQNGTEQRFTDIKYEHITEDAKYIMLCAQMAYKKYQHKIPPEIYNDVFNNITVLYDTIINIIIQYIDIDLSYRNQNFVTEILPQFINSIKLSLKLQNNYILYDYKQ